MTKPDKLSIPLGLNGYIAPFTWPASLFYALPTFPMYNAIYNQQRELTYTKSPFLKDKRGGVFA